jgi:hypothetical protein
LRGESLKLSLKQDETELDFEVVKEPWNKYNLIDGSNLKMKYILLKVKRTIPEKGKPSYAIKSQNIVEAYNVPENLRGPPAKVALPPEELKSAKKQEIGFSTLFEEWGEYLVEDGTRIRAKLTMVEVFRTERTNPDGEPIYIVNNGVTINIRVPKNLLPLP